MTRAAVLGGGSWGTTFAKVLVDAGCDVALWARRWEVVESVNDRHENPRYLPNVMLPKELFATTDPMEALDGVDLVAIALPSQTLRANLSDWHELLPAHATVISLMKGVELGTTKRMTQVIGDVTRLPADQACVITGPNLAPEIAREQPTATVVACADRVRAIKVQQICRTSYFRPYTNTDVIGCELAGAIKNVIALACGMAEGMGLGYNTRASLITRGLAEIAQLGEEMGADPRTFAGLAGLGDLVATCGSRLSRNRTLGERLGRGESLSAAQAAAGHVVEGVKTCRSVLDLASQLCVDMPITEAVERVCHEGLSPSEMLRDLMARETRSE